MNKLIIMLLTFIMPIMAFAQEQESKSIAEKINEGFKPIADAWGSIIFYSINLGSEQTPIDLPVVVVLLLLSAIIFTILFRFVNIRRFMVSINIVRGKYDDIEHPTTEDLKTENNEGEVSHFQALTAALSGTVGLGNIAGVAVALSLGGPGATFWMIIAGLLGMSAKFVECTLAVKYRDVGKDGTIFGGPMYYLRKGLADIGYSNLGKFLAVFFSIMVVGGSLGGGNMFQANQAAQLFTTMFNLDGSANLIFGIILACLVAIVILGGISRIGQITEKVVPLMVGTYFLAAIIILVVHSDKIGYAFGMIFNGAFSPEGIAGGVIGVMIQGFKRAAFSNEAGVGSAAIAHSAVKTKYAASEGLVALLEPFIDTVVVCTITALVIIITNGDGNIMTYGVKSPDGVLATSKAFESVLPWFPYVLTLAVILFAFSSMLSWSYYGLQGWLYLFGRSKLSQNSFKIIFCLFIIIGSVASLNSVTDFSDAMIFAMAIPNIIGLFFLYPKVKEELVIYLKFIKEEEKK